MGGEYAPRRVAVDVLGTRLWRELRRPPPITVDARGVTLAGGGEPARTVPWEPSTGPARSRHAARTWARS